MYCHLAAQAAVGFETYINHFHAGVVRRTSAQGKQTIDKNAL